MCKKAFRLGGALGAVVLCVALVPAASADYVYMEFMDMDFAVVGNPGNAGITRSEVQTTRHFGAVGTEYLIGKYPITTGQYREFLNAVAKTDPNNLWVSDMWTDSHGCKIERTGSSGSYVYSVAPDSANRPVNMVSFWSAARFVNWLHNGRPTGPQGPGTTEAGAYINIGNQYTFARTDDAVVWLPTHHEWYKAAYHNNSGMTGEDYFYYPTGTDSSPSNQLLDPDPGNNANFYGSGYTIGAPHYRTEVGAFGESASPYGTFDQGGNVFEWTETASTDSRMMFGGWYMQGDSLLHARVVTSNGPSLVDRMVGFRVAADYWHVVPEPGSATLLLFAAIAGLLWRRR